MFFASIWFSSPVLIDVQPNTNTKWTQNTSSTCLYLHRIRKADSSNLVDDSIDHQYGFHFYGKLKFYDIHTAFTYFNHWKCTRTHQSTSEMLLWMGNGHVSDDCGGPKWKWEYRNALNGIIFWSLGMRQGMSSDASQSILKNMIIFQTVKQPSIILINMLTVISCSNNMFRTSNERRRCLFFTFLFLFPPVRTSAQFV